MVSPVPYNPTPDSQRLNAIAINYLLQNQAVGGVTPGDKGDINIFGGTWEIDLFANPLNYGAVADGTSDCSGAFSTVTAMGKPIFLPVGDYKIASNVTLSQPIIGYGRFVVPSGVTLTINSEIMAGARHLFDCSGGGSVVIDGRANPTGWGEWWGLVPESPASAASNTAAINAAVIALRETRLQAKTYYTNDQITVGLANRCLKGAFQQYDGSTEGRVTRILCTSATAHIVYAGASSFTSIGALPIGIIVSDIYLDRSVAPNVTSGCTGLFNRYTKYARFENVKSNNSVHSFQFTGTVHTKTKDCHALRDTAGTGGTDIWRGFYIEGSSAIGLNGSNASLYLTRPVAELGTAVADSVGIYADGKMTDMFVHYPETVATTIGVKITGNAANTTLNYDNTDIEIVGPKLDQFSFAGIELSGLNKYGSVDIQGGYYGAGSGATASILISNNLAAVNIDAGQFLMGVAPTAYGVRVVDSDNVTVSGCQINEATVAAVVMDNASNCLVTPRVKNNSVTCAAAVQMFNACDANVISPMVSGGASLVSYGIQVVGTGDNRNKYEVSGIDSACLPAANRKLDRNGTAVTAIGLTGTNYATGVFT